MSRFAVCTTEELGVLMRALDQETADAAAWDDDDYAQFAELFGEVVDAACERFRSGVPDGPLSDTTYCIDCPANPNARVRRGVCRCFTPRARIRLERERAERLSVQAE